MLGEVWVEVSISLEMLWNAAVQYPAELVDSCNYATQTLPLQEREILHTGQVKGCIFRNRFFSE